MALSSRHDNVWTHSYYMKVCNLREGSSGSVHLAVDLRYGNQVAIKFIPRGSSRYAALEGSFCPCNFTYIGGLWLDCVHRSCG